MNAFNFWCIIIPLIMFLLGWLLGRFYNRIIKEEKETINDNVDIIANLKADLEACKKSKLAISKDLDACVASKLAVKKDLDACLAAKADISTKIDNAASAATNLGFAAGAASSKEIVKEPELIFDSEAAKLALGKKIVADDLKIVEGIGPKISQLFNENGVTTWYQLSQTPVDRCQEILDIGGKRYEIHNPGTWPKQAKLAFEGKWKELNDLQDYLDGGVEPKS